MKRHQFLWKTLTLAALLVAACVVAVSVLYYTGLDFRA